MSDIARPEPAANPTEATAEPASPASRRRAFLSLGSNLGDRRAYLRQGLRHLPDVVAVSPVYETEPVGGPLGQRPHLNCVVELASALSPRQLLEAARAAEEAAGRRREVRWGPRTLDVDVLLVGELTVDQPDLTVPHPRMWQRGFVMVPLADLAPEIVAERGDEHLIGRLGAGVVPAGTLAQPDHDD